VGGAEYLRSLQGPLAAIPLVPTGGVTLENAPGLLQAGALAVGLSTDLFPRVAIAQADWAAITTRAQALVHSLGVQA
jgi:2-dehydro-3-deoxyphosphogluconate aldolase/(4S)-4-hydroxy-2-oxoglutarate aldolase